MGLFHDFPETRIGEVLSAGRPSVRTADPDKVIADHDRRANHPYRNDPRQDSLGALPSTWWDEFAAAFSTRKVDL